MGHSLLDIRLPYYPSMWDNLLTLVGVERMHFSSGIVALIHLVSFVVHRLIIVLLVRVPPLELLDLGHVESLGLRSELLLSVVFELYIKPFVNSLCYLP